MFYESLNKFQVPQSLKHIEGSLIIEEGLSSTNHWKRSFNLNKSLKKLQVWHSLKEIQGSKIIAVKSSTHLGSFKFHKALKKFQVPKIIENFWVPQAKQIFEIQQSLKK